MAKKIKLWILISCILLIRVSFAIGLGELKVLSYLNDPLVAEITLTGIEELEVDNILIDLAGEKDFVRAGIAKDPLLDSFKFVMQRDLKKGETKVQILTDRPLKEPYVDFLVQLTWPEGSIVKNYTILLDPSFGNTLDKQLATTSLEVKEDLDKVNQYTDHNIIPINDFENLLNQSADPGNSKNRSSNKVASNRSYHKIQDPDPIMPSDSEVEMDNVSDDSAKKTLLSNIVSSLNALAYNSSNNKTNYAKLLDLKPSTVLLSKDEQAIAEQSAIAQINSELDKLRTVNDSTGSTNSKHASLKDQLFNDGDNNPAASSNKYNLYYTKSKNLNSKSNFMSNATNDLMLALGLVSVIVFMLMKILPTNNLEAELLNSTVPVSSNYNIPPSTINPDNIPIALTESSTGAIPRANFDPAPSFITNNIPTALTEGFSGGGARSNFDPVPSPSLEHNGSIDNLGARSSTETHFIRDEELELKMALANQYIAAGDRKSAKELLEEIINVKEQRYKVEISKILKSIS